MSLRIVNIIASTRIKGSIDIETLSCRLPRAQYDPEIFPGLVYKRGKHEPTIIMFASGKISSHGAKTEGEAKEAITATLKEIQEMGCILGDNRMDDISIENVVGTADLGRELDLESIATRLRLVVYEPDQFPGLMYRPFSNSVVCLLFSSGKVVIVGGKSENQVRKTLQLTKSVLGIAQKGQVKEIN